MNKSGNELPQEKKHTMPDVRCLSSDASKQACQSINEGKTEEFFAFIDRIYQANLAKMTAGISPAAMASAGFSWLAQLSQSPGHLLELMFYPVLHGGDALRRILTEPQPADGQDVRFHTENWQTFPWRAWAEGFLQLEDWWRRATVDIPGVPSHVERTVSFCVRQMLDALSPSNFVLTNPDLFQETIRTGGKNIIRGLEIGVEDMLEKISGAPPKGAEHFIPGKNVAVTPGRVVYRNHLIELIQYEPQTETVFKEPLLILPAWIMKYYILDLSPHNSMVRWLVSQGHTVFIVSWRNPDGNDHDLSMYDYYRLGAVAAIDAVEERIPNVKIHLMGYCLGGTLALITAATMARERDKRLKSLTLLAAQGDFTEAGELMLFITESEVSFLENMMWDQGYLDTKQMAGSFQMLRSYDLIWSKMVQDYMHGTERGMIDLLAWNADATRMPYKMHSEYLEKLFLNNDFAAGRYMVEGSHIAAENIRIPAFVVSTEKDHVAPWPSVYKIHLMINSDITFVLTNGGHNAGIVSEPNHPGRFYRIREHKKHTPYVGPRKWYEKAEVRDGSWWFAWHNWLAERSSLHRVEPHALDSSLPAAPGSYVLQK
ncbi:PHA/PHB synthase family protein [Legionella oakridgensis]|uniref:PHA/PHB synthase family protein n=1 Tax=Legionella oakridgensis TaxID=29423 RepID=UPI0003DE65CE|nr:alpha/beta fold hydrolase [Legionella oakridgensis]ETO94023.1 poly(3-hydroxyalkanoate) synthetase [Legionella oakridgensis RV-2-2007]